MDATKTATLIKASLPRFTGQANLYRLSEPLTSEWGEGARFDYVIVSSTIAMFSGPETYIFGADAEGNVLDWSELPGSFRGALDHEEALSNAGYTVVPA